MRARLLPLVLLPALLAGCGSSEPTAEPASTAASTTAAPVPTLASSSPSPDPQQIKTLLAALRGIDPRLVENPDRAVSRSRNTCSSVQQAARGQLDPTKVVPMTVERFTGGSLPELTAAQAQKIIDAVKATFCR